MIPKRIFQQPLLQSSASHDQMRKLSYHVEWCSRNILLMLEMLKTVVMLIFIIYCGNHDQDFLMIRKFNKSKNIHIFTVTFDQFNACLLNKIINLKEKS